MRCTLYAELAAKKTGPENEGFRGRRQRGREMGVMNFDICFPLLLSLLSPFSMENDCEEPTHTALHEQIPGI